MTRIAVVGCGVVGAAIAYELSRIPGMEVEVLDRQPPAQAATAAALGVLMGVISKKVKGTGWRRRWESLERYEILVPELEALTGQSIPFNRQGILMLCFAGEDLTPWQELAQARHAAGLPLEILDREAVRARYPHLADPNLLAGVYSPRDRQVDPTRLTQALVAGAAKNGATFRFDVAVEAIAPDRTIQASSPVAKPDWIAIAAGLGSAPLATPFPQPIKLQPVLGQGLQVRLPQPLGRQQPVITGDDVHIVPLPDPADYWIGATVEFPPEMSEAPISLTPDPDRLETVRQRAIAFCPKLAEAKVVRTWWGLRPRPVGQPAPVIQALPGCDRILLATGHYRNGILLAPATALEICQMICEA